MCHTWASWRYVLLPPFNGLFSRTTSVSRYQKGKTSLDLNEARDDGVFGCSGISWTICKQSAPHCRQMTTPQITSSLNFYRPDALPGAQPTVSKHWRQLEVCTHTHLTALCPGLPGWAGTRKVKPIWILLKQETVSGSGISWAHRHRVDKYLDTLLAKQPISDGEATDRCKSLRRKMADCPS